ncbi:MAG: hypothetical protein ACE5DO_12510 [Desulfobacterales bacterium]
MKTKVYQMKQYKLVGEEYTEIGIWTMPADRMSLEIEIDDNYPEEKEEANWIINRLVDAEAFPLPEDFLEYWQEQLSPYEGMMGKIKRL